MSLFDKQAYDAATVSDGGGNYQKMPAGGYVCAIQAVRTSGMAGGREIDYVQEKQYVVLIWDIIEGDFAGKYSEDYWTDPARDYGHRFYFSWKNLGAFKGVVQCFDESNPGFDAFAAADAENWGLFVGKKIGFVIGEEEYEANNGEIKTRYTLPRAKSVQDIREGKYRVPALKKLEGAPSTSPAPAASKPVDTFDDVPFSV